MISSAQFYIVSPEVKLSPFINSHRKASNHTKYRFTDYIGTTGEDHSLNHRANNSKLHADPSSSLGSFLAISPLGIPLLALNSAQHLTSCLSINCLLVFLPTLCRKTQILEVSLSRYFSRQILFFP